MPRRPEKVVTPTGGVDINIEWQKTVVFCGTILPCCTCSLYQRGLKLDNR